MATPKYKLLPQPTFAPVTQVRPVRRPESRIVMPDQAQTSGAEGRVHTVTGVVTDIKQEEPELRPPVVFAKPSPFLRLFARLNLLSDLPANWNSYGSAPPNRTARFRAYRVLEESLRANLVPQAVKASPEEGIGIVFISDKGQSTIECLNSGSIFMVISRFNAEPNVRPVDPDHIKDAINEIQTSLLA